MSKKNSPKEAKAPVQYGLFAYEYDHFEWENLQAVSSSRKKLVRYHKDQKGLHELVGQKDHLVLRQPGTPHCLIKRVKTV
jgi:hypothetical protein